MLIDRCSNEACSSIVSVVLSGWELGIKIKKNKVAMGRGTNARQLWHSASTPYTNVSLKRCRWLLFSVQHCSAASRYTGSVIGGANTDQMSSHAVHTLYLVRSSERKDAMLATSF